jgi:hypothetical protein
MAIWLTPEECLLYAPDIKLSNAELTAAIAQAQAIAESPLGANRTLSVEPYTEISSVPLDGKLMLSRMPIRDGSLVAQIRSGSWEDGYGRQSTPADWIQLTSDQYRLDPDYGELAIASVFVNHRHPVHRGRAYLGYRRPTFRTPEIQVRVQYLTGFDFTQQASDVEQLKVALSAIVKLRQSSQFQGVKLMDVRDEGYQVEYAPSRDFAGATGRIGGSLIDEWLSIFRKYRPREFAS